MFPIHSQKSTVWYPLNKINFQIPPKVGIIDLTQNMGSYDETMSTVKMEYNSAHNSRFQNRYRSQSPITKYRSQTSKKSQKASNRIQSANAQKSQPSQDNEFDDDLGTQFWTSLYPQNC